MSAIGRRALLRGALAVGGARLKVRSVQAAQKVSKAEARYQDHPNGGLSCAACTLFRAPAGCTVVEGAVSPSGWCRFFDLPD